MSFLALPLLCNIPCSQAVHAPEFCLFPSSILIYLCHIKEWMSTPLVMVDCKHAAHPAYQEEHQAHKKNTSVMSTTGDKHEPEPFACKRDPPGLVWFWIKTRIVFCAAARITGKWSEWIRTGICQERSSSGKMWRCECCSRITV